MSSAAEPITASDLAHPPTTSVHASASPAHRTELAAVIAFAIAADLWVFRSYGFSATATFFLTCAILLIGLAVLRNKTVIDGHPNLDRRGLVVAIMLAILFVVIARLVWLGSAWTAAAAVVASIGLAMACSGRRPEVLEGMQTLLASPALGFHRLRSTAMRDQTKSDLQSNFRWAAWLVPLIVTAVFGCVFVFANPELFDRISVFAIRIGDRFTLFFQGISVWELPFCLAAAFVGAGMLRPLAAKILPDLLANTTYHTAQRPAPTNDDESDVEPPDATNDGGVMSDVWYTASRNTLIAVIVAFLVYLPFEFATLWRREFPEGFYYAGYAHQGAAWLTVALLLATVVLSVVFHSDTCRSKPIDTTRMDRLRGLAWAWSALNGVLAIAVYNRLMIYVGYNGMTRLRTVGFFGITLVVVGFLLVVLKIKSGRTFTWLIRAQLLALAGAFIAYNVFPVDYVAHRYNVARVLSGDSKPAVMIAVKPIDDEGHLPICDLVDIEDPIIRSGVRAILARQSLSVRNRPVLAEPSWHEFQGATRQLKTQLDRISDKWKSYDQNPKDRLDAITAFQDYAMQWY